MNVTESLSHLITREYAQGTPFQTIIDNLTKDGFSEREIRKAYALAAYPSGPRRWWALFNSLMFPWWSFLVVLVMFGLSIFGIMAHAQEEQPTYSLYMPPQPDTQKVEYIYGSNPSFANSEYFASVKQKMIDQKVDFISADLDAMHVEVYEQGSLVVNVPIATKGRPGSWWETPAGIYKIDSHEPKHLSGMGHVYQPWSMRFQGNFYIHGWPYYPDGRQVSTAFSGGCIRLQNDDAKQVYDHAHVGMPILVFEKEHVSDKKTFTRKMPDIHAASYLAVDVSSGFVFAQKQNDTVRPIASLTKLISSLVAAEYIDLDAKVAVPSSAIVFTSKPRLHAGQRVRVYDLLFPLLLESSNEAAETLASVLGHERFVKVMNAKAVSLGMEHTAFVDASGAGAGNTSSADDLYQLARYLTENRHFILDMTAGKVSHSAYGASAFTDIQNFNDFGADQAFIGGKVGETTAAQETGLYIFTVHLGGEDRTILIVVLGTDDRKGDTERLRAFIQQTYE
jgi:D-alanyl-D-alanine carboxypeptidase